MFSITSPLVKCLINYRNIFRLFTLVNIFSIRSCEWIFNKKIHEQETNIKTNVPNKMKRVQMLVVNRRAIQLICDNGAVQTIWSISAIWFTRLAPCKPFPWNIPLFNCYAHQTYNHVMFATSNRFRAVEFSVSHTISRLYSQRVWAGHNFSKLKSKNEEPE